MRDWFRKIPRCFSSNLKIPPGSGPRNTDLEGAFTRWVRLRFRGVFGKKAGLSEGGKNLFKFDTLRIDEFVKNLNSDGFVKSPRSRLANFKG
jgi:hypothetical protein